MKILAFIGISTCCYTIHFLLHYFVINPLEKKNCKSKLLIYPLIFIDFIFMILSAYIHVLVHLYDEQKEKEYKDKSYESSKKHNEVINSILEGHNTKIKQLAAETTALKDQQFDEYCRGREEGELAGERWGFKEGYKVGFRSCFDQAELSESDYFKMFHSTYVYDCKRYEQEQSQRQKATKSQD